MVVIATKPNVVETEFLIVGAGPAGASLACFLGQNGLKGIVISSSSGTADTPRSHITNPFAVECLRDLGLEEEVKALAVRGPPIQAMRWCQSMAGVEYGKALYWEGDPDTARRTAIASPCDWLDFLQSDMEPLLIRYATHHGFTIRFSTELVSAERESSVCPTSSKDCNRILCTVKDALSSQAYTIRTRFLFGADGARSIVARTFSFPFTSQPSQGVACNILINADLSHLMTAPTKFAGLHWLMKPDLKTRFGIAPVLRVIRPWDKWLFIAVTPGESAEDPFRDLTPSSPELLDYLREAIGDPTVDITVERLDPWTVRDSVAQTYASSEANVFLLGDAAHRHPPSYGLGSNTCIQDAYNLAWKAALVARGLAGPGLLHRSYSAERQPVGEKVVREANEGMGAHAAVWAALGMFAATAEEGLAQIAELSQAGEKGNARRRMLREAIRWQAREGRSVGLVMNQWYDAEGAAVWRGNEEVGERKVLGQGVDAVEEILVGTYPGSRLPHAWLEDPLQRRRVSTQDVAGKGTFVLLVGHGGERWRAAVANIAQTTGIPLRAVGVGFGLQWHDVYGQWEARREVGDDGCVLVRPDRFVAWRSMGIVEDCEAELLKVLNRVLFRNELVVAA